jgi:hypothetical protein
MVWFSPPVLGVLWAHEVAHYTGVPEADTSAGTRLQPELRVVCRRTSAAPSLRGSLKVRNGHACRTPTSTTKHPCDRQNDNRPDSITRAMCRTSLVLFGLEPKVETVGIEPTSATARKTASTSVAGALTLALRSPTPAGLRRASLEGVPRAAEADLSG